MLFLEHKGGVRAKRAFESLSGLLLSEFDPKYVPRFIQVLGFASPRSVLVVVHVGAPDTRFAP